ncbi:MAG: 6-pyruvoyl tetrahydropterin synthase [Peptococcaceae bacterium BICA1-7]|nr:MAG: 6-pyruvoyl tetrahydropterin synthase [Peptococcaceae bacterium BICA1-7]HBV97635.1 6-carboxytetrahydropterin synthase QueD [Desulfotomaculum sp.]
MYYLTIKRRFAAAHRLLGYGGECASLHGHTWTVEVQVAGEKLDSCGMLVDFKILKKMVDDIVSELDHNYINELAHFDFARGGINPTAENIASYIFKSVREQIENSGKEVCIQEVMVWESPDSCACYREDK